MASPDWAETGEQWLRPSPRLLAMRRAELAVAVVVIGGPAVVASIAASGIVRVIGCIAVVVAAVVAERVALRRYHSWGYCERSRDLLVRRGVFIRRLTVVPYGRMQFVDVSAGAAERVFGLSTIKLHTSAAASHARIPGLAPDEARRLRDRLSELGETQAAGV